MIESEAAIHEHLDIYHDLNTRFHVRTWNRECLLTPLALAMEIATLDLVNVLCVLVNNTGMPFGNNA